MNLQTLTLGPLATNCYLLSEDKTVIIDPAAESEKIIREISLLKKPVSHIIYTHAHWDHIGAGKKVKDATGAEVIIGKKDLPFLNDSGNNLSSFIFSEGEAAAADRPVEDGDIIISGSVELRVIETPGHTPGGISLYTDSILFSGDTLFFNSIGRTDLPGGNFEDLIESVKQKIFKLADSVKVFPGHGSPTSVGWEKKNNPFI